MVTNQASLFLIFIANGLLIGILFDFFRILRRVFQTSNLLTYIEDFLFWVLTGAIILYFIFIFNNGEIRLYMFLAIGIGVIIYMLLLSTHFIKINVTIINFCKQILSKTLYIATIPLKYFCKLIKKLFFKPISFFIINIRKNSTNFIKNIFKPFIIHKKIKNNVKN